MDRDSEVNVKKEIITTLIYIIVVFALSFLIVTFVGQRTKVSGSSMEATLHDRDSLIVDKISYKVRDPKRFEIIVFPYRYEEDTNYIKRIIGLPGETVRIDEDGNIYINGKILEEHYGKETILNPGNASTEILLRDDEYFVMGDNRNNSEDSRFSDVGPIKRDEIIGRAMCRVYPFNSIRSFKVDEE